MTAQNPAIYLQAGSHPAEDVRRFIAALLGDVEGILLSTDLAVTEKSGTPDMSVDVAGGRCFILGDEATYQGTYFCENRGVTNLVIAASDPTNERHDLIVAQVEDSDYSGATDAWKLAVITGTPAASPVDPAVPDNAISLARVNVAALATSILDASIDDLRTQAGKRIEGAIDTAGTILLQEIGGTEVGRWGAAGLALGNKFVAPAAVLDVRGDRTAAPFNDANGTTDGRLQFPYPNPETLVTTLETDSAVMLIQEAGNTGDAGIIFRQGTVDWGIYNNADDNELHIAAEAAVAVMQLSTTDVGIGRAPSTARRLAVTEDTVGGAAAEFRTNVDVGVNSVTGIIVQIGTDTDNPSSNDLFCLFRKGDATSIGSISGNGSGGVQYNLTSDRRLKEDRGVFEPDGSIIDDIIIRRFVRTDHGKSGPPPEEIGVFAQELIEVYPQAVAEGFGDPDEEYEEDEIGWVPMGVDYSTLVPVLIAELQQLRGRVAELEGKKAPAKKSPAKKRAAKPK